jgi:serine/threonine-protein kinase RsbW
MLRDSCLGVLVAIRRDAHGFSIQEREFLGAVVGQVAQALERARLSASKDQLAEISAYFARAAKVLAEGSDLADTLERLAAVALPALGDICLIDVVEEGGRISRMVAQHRDRSLQHLVNRLRTRYTPQPDGGHPAADVIRTGRTRWSSDMDDAFLASTTQDEEHLALTKTLGFRSYVSVPLQYDGETLGCVTLVSVTRRYGIDDVAFAEQLAEQVAAVVNKARRYDMETRTSHILQSTLLPKRFPEMPGLTLHSRYIAASEGLEVGGDFFDIVQVSNDRVAFMIGDVAGHDRNAAALMGQLRSAARTLVGRVASPADMIRALQQSWGRLDFDRMATGVFGQLDLSSGEVAMASAGHYPPLLVESGAAHFVPVTPSTPLGVRGSEPTNWHGWLKEDQALLLYTDGVIDERRLGSERSMVELAHAARGHPGDELDLSGLCDRVVETLSPDRVDDVALLAMRREATA